MRTKPGIPILLIALLAAGCAEVKTIDQETERQVNANVKLYKRSELVEGSYSRVGAVEAMSCKRMLWDTASKEDAVNQLRYRASLLGGNGVTDLACESEGTDLGKNCWKSITCSAAAIKIGSASNDGQVNGGARKNGAESFISEVDKPGYSLPEKPDNYAIVAGIEHYSGDLPDAQFASRDAEAVRRHLIALGYPERNIKFLTGSTASKSSLEAYLEDWLPRNVTENSHVLFYFSGHGAPDPTSNQAYLIPVDGNPSYLEKTGFPVKRLYSDLNALKAKQVIIALDSCFSGAGGRSILPQGARPLVVQVDTATPPNGKIVLFAATSPTEITSTLDEQGHGSFTYFFLKGIGGAAKNDEGTVTTIGLYNYLKPKVQDAASRQNRDQTPILSGMTSGDIVTFR